MKLGVLIGTAQRDWEDLRSFAIEAERIGVDSVWSAEFNGHDAFTPLAFIAGQTTKLGLGTGVATVGGRSAAMLAMSAASVGSMSNGRFVLGLGANGRQGLENWHGQPWHAASQHLKETVEVVRQLTSGQPMDHRGRIYNLPRDPALAIGMEPGLAATFPIFIAALSPKSLEVTGAIADGWVGGASFVPDLSEAFWGPIREGAKRAGRSLDGFDFMAPAFVFPDKERALAIGKPFVAEQLGRHGVNWEHSHHAAVYERSGYADLTTKLAERFAAGKPEEAHALVPDELLLNRCLVGSDDEIRERLRAYRNCGVTTVQAVGLGPRLTRGLSALARIRGLIDEVNEE